MSGWKVCLLNLSLLNPIPPDYHDRLMMKEKQERQERKQQQWLQEIVIRDEECDRDNVLLFLPFFSSLLTQSKP